MPALRLAAVALMVVAGACKKQGPAKPAADGGARIADAGPADSAPADARPLEKPTPKKVVIGGHSTCVVMSDKTLRCWGANAHGELGDGTHKDAVGPVTPKLHGVEDVVFGAAHACALLDDGSVACWGEIGFGRKQPLPDPTGVLGVTNARHVFARGGAGCATIGDESMICWGDVDAKGHVRSGRGAEHRVPTPVVGLDHVIAMSEHGALRADGGTYYWGDDGVPMRTEMKTVAEIASSGVSLCGRDTAGAVACVGGAPRCAVVASKPPPPLKKAKPAPKGKTKAKEVAKATAAKPVQDKPPALPIEVLKLPPAKHLAFDAGGMCVVTTSGRLECLDAGDACKVAGPWPDYAKLDAVVGHCTHSTEGVVKCWTVDGTKRSTTKPASAQGATMLAAGPAHGCAIVDDHVLCWGKNDHGELGRGVADSAPHPDALAIAFP
jgi:hypothetical protein